MCGMTGLSAWLWLRATVLRGQPPAQSVRWTARSLIEHARVTLRSWDNAAIAVVIAVEIAIGVLAWTKTVGWDAAGTAAMAISVAYLRLRQIVLRQAVKRRATGDADSNG